MFGINNMSKRRNNYETTIPAGEYIDSIIIDTDNSRTENTISNSTDRFETYNSNEDNGNCLDIESGSRIINDSF